MLLVIVHECAIDMNTSEPQFLLPITVQDPHQSNSLAPWLMGMLQSYISKPSFILDEIQ